MMTNPARKETDKLLDELEKKFEKEYEEAYASIKKEADAYFARFSKEDAIKKQMLQDGTLSKQQYTEWRAREMMTGTRYREMVDTLAKEMVKSDQLAMKALDTTMKDTLAINANYATYEVEKATGISTGWSLYNRDAVGKLIKDDPDLLPKPRVKIPDDMKWNRQHISSALAQGILQGESIDKITDRLMSVTDMDARAAIRNARTMVTSAENAGKEITYSRAEELGIKGKKMWMATHDKRTRESHALLDGETVDLDEPFSNGLMYPGDPEGDPEEVYNCRCTMVYVSDHSAFAEDYAAENQDLTISDMSYEQWKKRHEEKTQVKDVFIPLAARSVDFTPAKTLAEAEGYAQRFLGYNGKCSYKGIDVGYANQCNKVLTAIDDNFKVEGLHSIQPMNMRQNIWKNSTSEAAYRWGSGDLFINPQYYKNVKTFDAHKSEIDSLMQTINQNGQMLLDSGNYSGAKKDYIEALLQSGRQCVAQSYDFVEGTFVHEAGHMLDDQLFHKAFREGFNLEGRFGLQEALSESRTNFAKNISGYAMSSNAEYVAESFTAWWYGEGAKVDPVLTQTFERMIKNG